MNIALIKEVSGNGEVRYYSTITEVRTRELFQEEMEKDGADNETLVAFIDTDNHTLLPDRNGRRTNLRPAFAALEALAKIDDSSKESIGRALELLVRVAFAAGMDHQAEVQSEDSVNEGLPTLDDYLQQNFDNR